MTNENSKKAEQATLPGVDVKPMVSLHLEIDQRVVAGLKDTIGIKKMLGEFYGDEDEFVLLIIQAVEQKKKGITIIPKNSN